MRDSGTRNFNAVPPIRRGNDGGRKRIIIAAMIAVAVAIAVFAVLIILEIADLGGQKSDGPIKNSVFEGVSFEDRLYSSSDIHKGELLLINASFNYVFPDETPNFLRCYDTRTVVGKSEKTGNNIYSYYTQSGATMCARFEPTMLAAFNSLADDFYRATGNYDLFIYDEDGYRTYDEQTAKNQKKPADYAPAGQTEHHMGTSIDLYGNISSSQPIYKIDDPQYASIYKWIYDNAYKYGFVHRYPEAKSGVTGVTYEPYHFRYVGKAHAEYMTKNNLCLEEYLDLLRDSYGKNSPLYFTGEDGTEYMIYYVAASTDNLTGISVPAEGSAGVKYTVSGDNKAGFIVTVEKEAQVS